MNVIFIDDEEDIHDFFNFLIETMDGVEHANFTTHDAASRYLDDNPIDYLFIDWRMPEGNGEDFIVKNKNKLTNTKKILVTGELELTEDQKYYFDKVIYKPFRSEEIRNVINA